MKITYDKVADAIYFYLRKSKVAKTICVNKHVNLDVDKDGEIIGIELLYTSSQQGKELEKNIRNGVPIEVISSAPVGV